jgi:hypothetical protein
MQSNGAKRRFATKKQEVQSLFLGGFSEGQVSAATGVHRRNVYNYACAPASPRAIPRELTENELGYYKIQVGDPVYLSSTAPDTHVIGCMNIIGSAGSALERQKVKMQNCGIPTDDVEDVEHYYERRMNALKRKKG